MTQKFRLGFGHFAISMSVASLLLVSLVSQTGCHRSYYRREADVDAKRMIREKQNDPRWDSTADGGILIDPQSRMFDPFSADHPPIPPDDPKSHQLMQCVDGKPGYPHWHANGDTSAVENPMWRSYLPADQNGQVVMDSATAYQLAVIHSPELQEARETLYLSALDVSLQRFGFDVQGFAGFNSFLETNGKFRGGDTTLTGSPTFSLSKLGITGTQFAAGLANEFLWNFAGPTTNSVSSILNFSVVQPLLRDAGRVRVLEALTQAERNLLADVRQFDRFRRGFYLAITSGGAPNSFSGRLFFNLPSFAQPSVGGYLGLLQEQQSIRILEFSVGQFEDILDQFREFYRRERIDANQLRRFENQVYTQQERLLRTQVGYRNRVDNFKRLLGLPPGLDVLIQDDYLDRFEFISDELLDRQTKLNQLRSQSGSELNQLDELLPETSEQADNFPWPDNLADNVRAIEPYISLALGYLDGIQNEDAEQLRQDFDLLQEVRPRRLAYLDKLRKQIEAGNIQVRVEPVIFEPESVIPAEELREAFEKIETNAVAARAELEALQSRLQEFDAIRQNLNDQELYNLIESQIIKKTSSLLSAIYSLSLELSLLQAEARANSIELPEIDLDAEQAFRIARCFRRDWMNARAALVDEWRNVEFTANQLESDLDLIFEGDMGVDPNGQNPFKFRADNGSLRAGFRFDTPLVRQTERNDYREALIRYQQTRRAYYLYEDEVMANFRALIRGINLNKVVFELSRQNIKIAIEQLELSRLDIEDPAQVRLGPTAALNLVDAINGLNNTQNSFLNVWVQNEVFRRALDFNLGTIQIDPDGVWIDPEVIDDSIGYRAAAMLGIDLGEQCYCDLEGINDGFPPAMGIQNDPTEFDEQAPAPTPADKSYYEDADSKSDVLPVFTRREDYRPQRTSVMESQAKSGGLYVSAANRGATTGSRPQTESQPGLSAASLARRPNNLLSDRARSEPVKIARLPLLDARAARNTAQPIPPGDRSRILETSNRDLGGSQAKPGRLDPSANDGDDGELQPVPPLEFESEESQPPISRIPKPPMELIGNSAQIKLVSNTEGSSPPTSVANPRPATESRDSVRTAKVLNWDQQPSSLGAEIRRLQNLSTTPSDTKPPASKK